MWRRTRSAGWVVDGGRALGAERSVDRKYAAANVIAENTGVAKPRSTDTYASLRSVCAYSGAASPSPTPQFRPSVHSQTTFGARVRPCSPQPGVGSSEPPRAQKRNEEGHQVHTSTCLDAAARCGAVVAQSARQGPHRSSIATDPTRMYPDPGERAVRQDRSGPPPSVVGRRSCAWPGPLLRAEHARRQGWTAARRRARRRAGPRQI